jgi:hypothetical protein
MPNETAISIEDAERLKEISDEIIVLVNEFKDICRSCMSSSEYGQFKYRTLGRLEPAVMEDHEWMTQYSSIDSLEEVANKLYGIAEEDEEDEEDEEEEEE